MHHKGTLLIAYVHSLLLYTYINGVPKNDPLST